MFCITTSELFLYEITYTNSSPSRTTRSCPLYRPTDTESGAGKMDKLTACWLKVYVVPNNPKVSAPLNPKKELSGPTILPVIVIVPFPDAGTSPKNHELFPAPSACILLRLNLNAGG